MGRLEGKTAIVTGGGGAGIGRAISTLFAQEGATVAVVDKDGEGAKTTVDMMRNDGREAFAIQADVTKESEVNSMVTKVLTGCDRIDILVNNAGKARGVSLGDIAEVTLDFNVTANLKSAFLCTKAVIVHMIDRRSGSVIFISSINALLGGFSETAYAAAKAGLHSFAQTLTADYSPLGIRFNVICPGSVPETSRTWRHREKEKPGTLKKLADLYPLRQVGRPIDIAYAALFLASDEASWITGVVLPVDGGITATGGLPGGEWWKQKNR